MSNCLNIKYERKDRLQMQFDIKKKEDRDKLSYEVAFYIMTIGYQNMKKFLYIPVEYITDGGFALGKVWADLQEEYDQNRLEADDIRFLLGVKMPLADSSQKDLGIWLDRADEAEVYYKEHGTLSMPNATLFNDGVNMFQWVHHQKKSYRLGELSLYQITRLENMGIQWIKPKKIAEWDMAYSYAEQYYEENGHLFVGKREVTSDGFELGKWIQEQRESYLGLSRQQISEERIEMLEDIGMFWEDLKNAEWDWFVGLLRECIKKTEKPFAIGKNYRYKNYALGEQVGIVIKQYAEGRLTTEQERDLRKAGFKFSIHIR